MDTIEVLYRGELSDDILQYVCSSPATKVVATSPLIIATGNQATLPGLLGAISHSPMKVDLVKVRRHLNRLR